MSNLQVVQTKEESHIENDIQESREDIDNTDPHEISILKEERPNLNDNATKMREDTFDVMENEEGHNAETKSGIGKKRRESGEKKRNIQESQLGNVSRNSKTEESSRGTQFIMPWYIFVADVVIA